MNRFHVHAHVDDLVRSIAFCTRMFGAEPVRVEADYAKWMLEDPRLNLAIATRGEHAGIDHLGIQTDTEAELAELKDRARAADLAMLDEGETTCCYARSDKHWLTDPQGIAWEQYHTLGDIPVFSEKTKAVQAEAQAPEAEATTTDTAACCAPRAARGRPIGIPVAASSGPSCC